MGQYQDKFAKVSDIPMNGRLSNGFTEERNNNISSSCLRNNNQHHSPRKNRVTFDPSSKYQDERVLPLEKEIHTLNIQPKERLIDSGVVKTIPSVPHPIQDRYSESYRRSLRIACSGEANGISNTRHNGHETRISHVSQTPQRAIGSFSSTYRDDMTGTRCSSDHSFWSSDYSTSAGGTLSEKSNSSSDSNAVIYLHNTDHKYTPIHVKHRDISKTSQQNNQKLESLQERLRQHLSVFDGEQFRKKHITNINNLPEHILLNIFSFLPTKFLCRASGVCKKWQQLSWDPILWKTMVVSRYSGSDIDKVIGSILTKLASNTQGLCLTLRHITLIECECLSDRGLDYIAKFCIDLTRLEVIGCPCIMSRGVQVVLENCLRLDFLDVRGCSCVNSICYNMITNIQSSNDAFFQIKYLDLSDCVAVDDLGLRALGLTCQVLETLHMRRCTRITDVGMQHVASHCRKLKELSISDCHKVRDFSLKEIAKYCTSLRYLSLMRCTITDAGVKVIGRGCSNLRYLNVRGCTCVSDIGVIHIAQNCLKLRSLDVGKCDVTNNSLNALGVHCPQLKRLSIKGCFKLTDVGIRAVVAQCCLLRYLNVEDCSITLDTYEFVREHCQNCVIDHTSLDI